MQEVHCEIVYFFSILYNDKLAVHSLFFFKICRVKKLMVLCIICLSFYSRNHALTKS